MGRTALSLKSGVVFADRVFPLLLLFTLFLFIGAGLYFRTVKPRPSQTAQDSQGMKTRFLIEEPKPQTVIENTPQPAEKKKVQSQPIDLTETKETDKELIPNEDNQEDRPKEKVRAVYGLRKVYSTGIGSGGAMSDAVVGRLGNTLNKEVDTLTATESDLKGRVVSAATVTSAPKVRRQVRPEYTKEMLDNKIEGTVRVRTLVDIDGMVKRTELLNDLGHGSGDQALKAVLSTLFHPALRDDEPVAVWIIIPIRFVLLS